MNELLAAEGRYSEAAAVIRQRPGARGKPPSGGARVSRWSLALSGDSVGARGEIGAIEAEARVRYVDGFWPAMAYTALGDRGRAIGWLERALIARSANIPTMRRSPELANLRSDPRFESIARRAG